MIARSFNSLLVGAGALALIGASSVLSAQPQRRAPDPNAKFVLVEVFRANGLPEKELGEKASDEMRKRIGREISNKEVYLIPKEEMVGILEASGFPSDVPLEPHDVRALAANLRADEYITGTATKIDTGYTVTANLVLTRDASLVQPLGTVSSKKLNDAIEVLGKELAAARAQLPAEQRCVNLARELKYDEAAAAAREGIAAYPKAVLARICLANVMVAQDASSEDLLKISREIVELNPKSRGGLSIKAQAFQGLNMPDSAITTLTTLLATNPGDARLQKDVIDAITAFGNPRIARPIVEEAVAQNPGDSELLRLRWLILLAVTDYKEAFEAGEDLVRLDTAFADTAYFLKTAAAYAADSQPQKAAELAARGVAKFPDHPGLNRDLVVNLRSTGQNQQALEVLQRATAAGVEVEQAGVLRLLLTRDVSGDDAAWDVAKQVVASGDTASAAPVVLTIANARFQAASGRFRQDSAINSIPEFDVAIASAAYADSVSKGETKAQAKFLFGAANLYGAQSRIMGGATTSNCDMVKKGKDMLIESQINLPAGGSFAPEQVPQLMASVMQLDAYADQVIPVICK